MYYAFTPDSIFKTIPPKSSDLGSEPYVILIHCSPNPCKWNYLYGNLPFYKIQVNHFMAWDDSPGAKIISKCTLWVKDLVPFSEF